MPESATILTIRSHTGLSGDMLLTGLAVLEMRRRNILPESAAAVSWLDGLLSKIMPQLAGCVRIERTARAGIGGYKANVNLPHEHEHRNLADIAAIISASGMEERGREMALACFGLLAEAEGHVHGISTEEVHFHEVGALDSILDICAVCELYAQTNPLQLVCSPLPLADGSICCAHGQIPAPAPAALELLQGVEVRPFSGSTDSGELVTPTALALLRVMKAVFQGWPAFRMEYSALVYGQKFFPGIANGAIFAAGSALSSHEDDCS